MIERFFTILIVAFFFFVWAIYSYGASGFPPLSYLASELGVAQGAPLPKGVIWNGRPFVFYITSAQEHANGRYTVELQAR